MGSDEESNGGLKRERERETDRETERACSAAAAATNISNVRLLSLTAGIISHTPNYVSMQHSRRRIIKIFTTSLQGIKMIHTHTHTELSSIQDNTTQTAAAAQ